MERSTLLRFTPRPAVRLACGSMSMQRTLNPSSARAPARLIAVVVLPTPPFWLAIAITWVTGASPRIWADGDRAVGGRKRYSHATPSELPSGTPVIHTLAELFTESVDIDHSREPVPGSRASRALTGNDHPPPTQSSFCAIDGGYHADWLWAGTQEVAPPWRPTRNDSTDSTRCES